MDKIETFEKKSFMNSMARAYIERDLSYEKYSDYLKFQIGYYREKVKDYEHLSLTNNAFKKKLEWINEELEIALSEDK